MFTHLRPTFGCTISSRTYSTTASSAFMNPVGTGRPDFRIPAHDGRDDDEHERRDEPQHEHVLGHRQIDAGDRRQMNQRMIERAVGDVIDDGLAGVEAFGRRVPPPCEAACAAPCVACVACS